MSSPSLPGLPSELVLQIFTLLPGRRDVAALNRTSDRFYKVWRSNAAAISDAVLSRTIACYASAEELVRFQRAQERELETIEEETDELEVDEAREAYQEVLKRNKRFTINASIISDECRNLSMVAFSGFGHDHLRLRYRIHSIAALSNDEAAQTAYLEATSLSELHKMRQDSIWSNPRHYYTEFEYFCIYIRTRTARDPFELIDQAYEYKWRLEYLHP